MPKLGTSKWMRHVLAFGAACVTFAAHAGLSVYTNGTTSPPNPAANQRTIDFGPTTLATEQSASKLTYASANGACNVLIIVCINSGGSVSYTSTSSLTGFSGNVMSLTSGTTSNATSVTVNFTSHTPYVGFLWGVEFAAPNSMVVNLTLADNSVVTLKNCTDTANAQCIANYVPQSWWNQAYNALLGWLLGDAVDFYAVYVQYQPSNGVKIKSAQFVVKRCENCGFLSADTSQDFKVDNFTYVDAAAAPHHLEITTATISVPAGSSIAYTVKACGDATCSLPYINGVTGTLSLTGAGLTPSYASGANFSIAPGPTNTATVMASLSPAGTATVGLSAYSPTPSNAQKVFCGIGSAAAAANSCTFNVVSPLHHIELTAASNSAVTCTPLTYTVKACSDLACTPYTAGLTGTLNVSGVTVNYPAGTGFTIANGSSSTTISAHATTTGTATASLSGLSATPSNAPSVFCGMGGNAASGAACGITMNDAAFLFDVPPHASDAAQSVTVSAVKSLDNATVCAPAFTAAKNVTFKCSYSNPVTGTLPIKVGGMALNAGNNANGVCDGTGQPVSLSFNGSGVATTTVQYADVGRMTLTARYVGSGTDAGLVMQGTDTFVAAPASFSIAGYPSGLTVAAGSSFTATVAAKNNSGATTPNFGNETTPEPAATATLSFNKSSPSGVNAQSGSFSGSLGAFSNGVAASSSLTWTEVGAGDLTVALTGGNYLGSALTASGTTGTAGAVGNFVPHHFTTETTQGCSGTFTYSGQPFTVKVVARNAANDKVYNYDGTASTSPNKAKAVTLSATSNGGAGTLTNASIAATSFSQGEATVITPTFTFTNKLTGPASLTITAADANATSSGSGVPNGEGSVAIRSGRLRFSNAFGSERDSLILPVQTQFWSGKSWIKSSGDSCTSVLSSAVALSGYTNAQGGVGTWTTTASPITLSNGQGALTLTAPSPVATGSANLAINLGNTTADNACLATHPATLAANLSWLRANNGNCSALNDRDPSARATFGIYNTETKKTVYVRMVE